MDRNSNGPPINISDELLNAFIDRQIANEERQEILSLLKKDDALAHQACELQRLKEMTSLAYDDIPPSQLPASVVRTQNRWPRMAAAIAIFCLGLLIGVSGVKMTPLAASTQDQVAEQSITKILVHLTSADTEGGLNTLNNLEQLLEDYQARDQVVRIQVVANGHGIKLFDPKNTVIAHRIARLSRQYDNLAFAACKNTIQQMQIAEDRHVQLIPQVKLIDSGVVEVIRRQREGWTYIRG